MPKDVMIQPGRDPGASLLPVIESAASWLLDKIDSPSAPQGASISPRSTGELHWLLAAAKAACIIPEHTELKSALGRAIQAFDQRIATSGLVAEPILGLHVEIEHRRAGMSSQHLAAIANAVTSQPDLLDRPMSPQRASTMRALMDAIEGHPDCIVSKSWQQSLPFGPREVILDHCFYASLLPPVANGARGRADLHHALSMSCSFARDYDIEAVAALLSYSASPDWWSTGGRPSQWILEWVHLLRQEDGSLGDTMHVSDGVQAAESRQHANYHMITAICDVVRASLNN